MVLTANKIFIGVDPGASGGLAAIYPSWAGKTVAHKMPDTERDVWDWIRNCSPGIPVVAVIEKVQGFIGNPHPGNAMFKFGRSAGLLTGFLIAADIPFEEVTPQRWQKALCIPHRKRDEGKGAFKNRLKAVAQKLHPQTAITLATCDAVLLAEYCRRRHLGM